MALARLGYYEKKRTELEYVETQDSIKWASLLRCEEPIFLYLRPLNDRTLASETQRHLESDSLRLIPISSAFMKKLHTDRDLGILPDDRLLFLDRGLWVRTTSLLLVSSDVSELPPDDLRIERHFFIPYDWLRLADRYNKRIDNSREWKLLSDGRL